MRLRSFMMYLASYISSLVVIGSAAVAAAFPVYGRGESANSTACSANSIAGATNTNTAQANPKVIYFMSNDAFGNSIVAMKVAADGTLLDGSITATGGKGMSGIDGMTNLSAGPDALFSQSALKVEGTMILAVNPGSNTMTMMTIDAADPTKLSMVGQPVDTMGEFPNTAAISPKNKIACVGNTGAQAGIACFAIDAQTGLKPLMQQQIGFPIGQKTPPVGPTNTVSQVLFNQDETMLLTPVKGDPTKNNTGFLSILPIMDGGYPATQDTRTSPSGTAVLFGTALVPNTQNILATDAAFGAVTISIPSAKSNTVPEVLAKTVIAGQVATCWAAVSPSTKTAFVTDVAVNHLVEVDPANGQILQSTNMPNNNPGMIDLVAAGKMVYALSPGNGTTKAAVAVIDVSKRPAKLVQNFEPKGAGISSQGLTAFFWAEEGKGKLLWEEETVL